LWVLLARPQWNRSCEDCQKFIYEDDGQQKKNTRTGLPVLNTSGLTPCADCEKIPAHVYDENAVEIPKTMNNAKRLREHAVELTPRIAQAWQHYRECKAVNDFPNDPIVRANAVLFRDVEEQADRQRQEDREFIRLERILASLPRR